MLVLGLIAGAVGLVVSGWFVATLAGTATYGLAYCLWQRARKALSLRTAKAEKRLCFRTVDEPELFRFVVEHGLMTVEPGYDPWDFRL